MKTVIVTDSTAYLTDEELQNYPISVIPLSVIIEGKTYEEEIDISSSQFYELVRGNGPLPKTSQPPVGEFVKLYESFIGQYDEVVSIHLSSGISGTYTGAVQAGEMVNGVTVHPFDSEVSCAPQGFYVLKAAEMAQQGATGAEILEELERMKQSLRAYFMVDDLAHLQRGGRLSGAQAFIGGLLQVKPILHFQNKVIVPFEKIRTRKKAMNRIVELLKQDANQSDLTAVIIHGNCLEEAAQWKEQVEQLVPNVDFSISHFGPVIGTHLGEGSMGMGWVKKS